MSQSSISQHLAKLRDLGIVQIERQGQEIHYMLVDEDVKNMMKTLFEGEEDE